MIKTMFAGIKYDIDEYVENKSWYVYLPVWFFGIYLFVQLLHFTFTEQQPFIVAVASAFDFFLHEMAHIVTAFMPAVLTAAAGSFSELLLGTALIVTAIKGRSYFALLICSMWFMLACQSVGIYMADARAQRLPLFSLGAALSGSDEVTHDWYFVFGKLHLLNFDIVIGNIVRGVGDIVGLASLLFTAWLMYKMAMAKFSKKSAQSTKSSAAPEAGYSASAVYPKTDSPQSIYPEPKIKL